MKPLIMIISVICVMQKSVVQEHSLINSNIHHYMKERFPSSVSSILKNF